MTIRLFFSQGFLKAVWTQFHTKYVLLLLYLSRRPVNHRKMYDQIALLWQRLPNFDCLIVGSPPPPYKIESNRQLMMKRQKPIRWCYMTSPPKGIHTYTHFSIVCWISRLSSRAECWCFVCVCLCLCVCFKIEKVWKVWLLIHLLLHKG